MRAGEEMRWIIALLLNRFQDTCWADLVTWATYPEWHSFAEIFSARDKAGFCARNGETLYCGKCKVTDSILQ